MLACVHNLFENNPSILKLGTAAMAFIPLNFNARLMQKKRREKYWESVAKQVVTERD